MEARNDPGKSDLEILQGASYSQDVDNFSPEKKMLPLKKAWSIIKCSRLCFWRCVFHVFVGARISKNFSRLEKENRLTRFIHTLALEMCETFVVSISYYFPSMSQRQCLLRWAKGANSLGAKHPNGPNIGYILLPIFWIVPLKFFTISPISVLKNSSHSHCRVTLTV